MTGDTVTGNSQTALRAVVFADAVEYSRLVLENEPAALDLMRQCFRLFRSLAAENGGALVKTTGDGVVLAFESAVAAVACAVAAQRELKILNEKLGERRRAPFRIGIHLGEILYEGGDIYGHIVNVAARLQSLAAPGGICVSDSVYEQARHKLKLGFRSMGARRLKNMAEPVLAFRILEGAEDDEPPVHTRGRASISVLGGFSLAADDGRVTEIRSERVCALLGYLALCDRHLEFRERLAGLLFSGASGERAREALGTCVRSARNAVSRVHPHLLASDHQFIRLKADHATVDLTELSEQLSGGNIAEALVDGSAAPERILQGLEDVDDAFHAWLKITRHTWRDKLIRLLEANIADADQASDRQTRAAWALRAIDPTHELACRCLMNNHAISSNAPAALRLYAELKDRLETEFGIEPSRDTRQLAERIRSGTVATVGNVKTVGVANEVGEPAPTYPGRLPRIVIGSFSFGRQSDGPAHLLAGFRKALIVDLVRFREWILIEKEPGSAVVANAGKSADADSGDYHLQADCAKEHSAYILTVSFMHSRSRRYVWSERYRLTLQDWDKAQRDIVRQIAAGMGIYLSTERLMTQTGGGDISLQAYDKWLKGEYLLTMWSPAAEREAEDLFNQVIAEMPQFASAYCSLAGIYNVAHLINVGRRRDMALQARAEALAQRAVAIDPLNARSHLTLAWSYCMAGRYDQAELHYDMAMQLNPNNPTTLVSCAQGLAFAGRCDLSQAAACDALKLAPVLAGYQWAYLASARFICGDFEGCIEASDRAGSAIVDVPGWKAAALVALGRMQEARSAGQRLLSNLREAWDGDLPASDADLVDWILHGYPIKEEAVRTGLEDAIRAATIASD